VSKTRAEAFSDGIFAIAATLLVLDIQVPDVKSGLLHALLTEWPSYIAYAISFATIVVIWVNHHAVMDVLERLDRRLLFLNGLLLLTVAAIPFPTALVAKYIQAGHDQTTAAVAYGLTMTAMSVAFAALNLYSRRFRRALAKLDWVGLLTGTFLWPMGTLLSLINVSLGLAVYAFIVVFYVVLPILREDAALAAAMRSDR
jgi:uncharacterized membrane protein